MLPLQVNVIILPMLPPSIYFLVSAPERRLDQPVAHLIRKLQSAFELN
jgi:hypothetical protein